MLNTRSHHCSEGRNPRRLQSVATGAPQSGEGSSHTSCGGPESMYERPATIRIEPWDQGVFGSVASCDALLIHGVQHIRPPELILGWCETGDDHSLQWNILRSPGDLISLAASTRQGQARSHCSEDHPLNYRARAARDSRQRGQHSLRTPRIRLQIIRGRRAGPVRSVPGLLVPRWDRRGGLRRHVRR